MVTRNTGENSGGGESGQHSVARTLARDVIPVANLPAGLYITCNSLLQRQNTITQHWLLDTAAGDD